MNSPSNTDQPASFGRKRGHLGLLAAIAVLVTCGAGLSIRSLSPQTASMAKFSLRDSTGERVRLADVTRDGPALLVFGHSSREVAALASVTGVHEVAIVLNRDPVTELTIGRGIRYLVDPDGTLAAAFGAEAEADDPHTIILGSDGQVLAAGKASGLAARVLQRSI